MNCQVWVPGQQLVLWLGEVTGGKAEADGRAVNRLLGVPDLGHRGFGGAEIGTPRPLSRPIQAPADRVSYLKERRLSRRKLRTGGTFRIITERAAKSSTCLAPKSWDTNEVLLQHMISQADEKENSRVRGHVEVTTSLPPEVPIVQRCRTGTNEKLGCCHVLASICCCKADATKKVRKARVEQLQSSAGHLQMRGMSKEGQCLLACIELPY
ncbi:hypothetical protein B0T21DRAFT_343292 [Apiosordaria backusii]|uniref:Uncharacterized protein n=1 Tax=Apiosordaria backusii TaxID=314023 RepID=A0AA40EXT6_9PEZI|nr:hypothetical protein B0T21DRAFT_343292 [Apiosordaria backusii]